MNDWSSGASGVPEGWAVLTDSLNPEAVDLGLSVKWANMNVGALTPEGYGDYFAWGETEPKEQYDWATYKWSVGDSYNTITKYCDNASLGYEGFTDNKTTLDLEDDAAHANWGDSWRMPTDAEWTELLEQCTLEWTTQNGVNGKLVTGPNGNNIFLPTTGDPVLDDTNDIIGAGAYSHYWSSSFTTEYQDCALGVYLNFSDVYGRNYYERYEGLSIRPVSEQ